MCPIRLTPSKVPGLPRYLVDLLPVHQKPRLDSGSRGGIIFPPRSEWGTKGRTSPSLSPRRPILGSLKVVETDLFEINENN